MNDLQPGDRRVLEKVWTVNTDPAGIIPYTPANIAEQRALERLLAQSAIAVLHHGYEITLSGMQRIGKSVADLSSDADARDM